MRTHRTIEQDPAFGIQQIVDIALKTLSPELTIRRLLTFVLVLKPKQEIALVIVSNSARLMLLGRRPDERKTAYLVEFCLKLKRANRTGETRLDERSFRARAE